MPDQSTNVVLFGEGEARSAITAIRTAVDSSLTSFERALALVSSFEQAEGWRALGYRSLGACLTFELQVTRARAYDIIDRVRASALLTEEKEPSRNQARAALGKAPAKVSRPATESDQLRDEPEMVREEPITRSPFNGGAASNDFGYDDGAAVYKCRHCQRIGTLAELTLRRCLVVERQEVDAHAF